MERREEARRGEKGREKRASGETEEMPLISPATHQGVCLSSHGFLFITWLSVHTCPQSVSL